MTATHSYGDNIKSDNHKEPKNHSEFGAENLNLQKPTAIQETNSTVLS